MNTVERVKKICKERKIPIYKLEKDLGFANGYIGQLKKGVFPDDRLALIADYLGMPIRDMLDDNLNAPGIAEDVVSFPVMGTVAAGYEHVIYEDYTGDSVDIPRAHLKGRPAEAYFVLRIVGTSMYPQYQEGDLVLVLRQDCLTRSGDIGVVLYDDDKVTIKRVEYDDEHTYMKLYPINPQYPPEKIVGERLEHCRILGVPRLLIREIAE